VRLEVDHLERAIETLRANVGSAVETAARNPRQPFIIALMHGIEGSPFSVHGQRPGVQQQRLP